MFHALIAQVSAFAATPEWATVALAVLGLWGRMEYKLGKLSGQIEGMKGGRK